MLRLTNGRPGMGVAQYRGGWEIKERYYHTKIFDTIRAPGRPIPANRPCQLATPLNDEFVKGMITLTVGRESRIIYW